MGHDVQLDIDGDTVVFRAPSGYETEFEHTGDGEYTVDEHPGIDATLERQDDGSFELEWKDKQVYRFDGNGVWTAHEDANGNTIRFSYSGGVVSRVTDTRGRTVDFTYSSGRLASVRDNAGGRTYSYGYDNRGRLASSAVTAYGLGRDNTNLRATTRFGYDTSDRLVTITDPRGHATQIGYEGNTRKVASVTRPGGATTTFSYLSDLDECADEDGDEAETETKVDGPRTDVDDVTSHCFDEHHRQIAAIDAKGHRTTSEYTSNSNVTVLNESGVAGGPALGFTWEDDNLTGVELPTGGTASMDYDDTQANPHLPTGVRDFATDDDAPPVWSYRYDDNGNLIEASNATEDVTFRYCYNGDGTVGRIGQPPLNGLPLDTDTDGSACRGHAQGNDTLFTYNNRGELTKVDPPGDRGTETFTYDALSRVQTIVDGRGTTRSFTYDALDRVVRIDYEQPKKRNTTSSGSGDVSAMFIPPDDEDSTKVWINYTYDVNGNLTGRSDSNGNAGFTYDALNRMTREAPEAPSAVTTYSYDPAGNVTQIATSDQPAPVRYRYDEVNLVDRVTDQKGRHTTFAYDERGNRTQTRYPNGVTQASKFDDSSRMECTYAYTGSDPAADDGCPEASTSLLVFEAYSHERLDADTNRLETRTGREGETTSYGYDAISRLTDATTVDGDDQTVRRHVYRYDDRGNLTRQEATGSQVDDRIRTQAYDLDNALCWVADGDHDPDCGARPSGAERFVYDQAGNMTARGDMQLTYSLRGHTVEITPPGLPAIAMKYTDATQDRRILAGNTRMAYNQTGLSAQGPNNGNAQVWFPRDDAGRLVGMLHAAGNTGDVYYLFDRLGSVIATTSMDGEVVERYAYEPYGQQIDPNPADPNPWRYVSGYHDVDTGMIKFGTRYYMPDLGRWTQPDPETGNPSNPMTLNTYGYANCDPANNIDPTGRFPWERALATYGWMASSALLCGAVALAVGSTGLGLVASVAIIGGCRAAMFTVGQTVIQPALEENYGSWF